MFACHISTAMVPVVKGHSQLTAISRRQIRMNNAGSVWTVIKISFVPLASARAYMNSAGNVNLVTSAAQMPSAPSPKPTNKVLACLTSVLRTNQLSLHGHPMINSLARSVFLLSRGAAQLSTVVAGQARVSVLAYPACKTQTVPPQCHHQRQV